MQTQTAFLEALGWTLLSSWWQMGILWVVFLLIKKGWPKLSAALLYNVALVLLLGGLTWSAVSFVQHLLYPGVSPSYWSFPNNRFAGWYQQGLTYIQLLLPYLSIAYIGWLLLRTIQFLRIYASTGLLRKEGLYKAPVHWRLFAQQMAAQMNVRFPCSVWLSTKVDGPLLLGWLKPMILLPFTALNQLSAEQVEAILIHEIAHIRRNDFFWNLVLALTEILFYYNPFARQLMAAISAEREHACDDWVLQFPVDTCTYANALLKLEQQRQSALPPVALAAGGPHTKLLLWRVKRILQLPGARQQSTKKTGFLFTALALALMLLLVKPREEIRHFLQELATEPVTSLESRYATLLSPASPAASSANAPSALAKRPSGAVTSQAQQRQAQQRNDKPASTATDPSSATAWPNTELSQGLAAQLQGFSAQTQQFADQIKKFANQTKWFTIHTRQVADQALWDAENDYQQMGMSATFPLQRKALSFVLPDMPADYPSDVVRKDYMPYVPPNSFETNGFDDSLAQQLNALETKKAAVTVQLALKKLNWDRLQASLRRSGLSIDEIRFELEKELAKLDWSDLRRQSAQLTHELARQQRALLQKQAARSLRDHTSASENRADASGEDRRTMEDERAMEDERVIEYERVMEDTRVLENRRLADEPNLMSDQQRGDQQRDDRPIGNRRMTAKNAPASPQLKSTKSTSKPRTQVQVNPATDTKTRARQKRETIYF